MSKIIIAIVALGILIVSLIYIGPQIDPEFAGYTADKLTPSQDVTDNRYTLEVKDDLGITHVISESYPKYQISAWSSDPYGFDGFYDEAGKLLTRDNHLTITLDRNRTIYAAGNLDTGTVEAYNESVYITPDDIGGARTVKNTYTNKSYEIGSGAYVPCGKYDFETGFLFIPIGHTKVFDGIYERSWTFKYGGHTYNVRTSGWFSDADQYLDVYRGWFASKNQYFKTDGIQDVANQLAILSSGMTELERANFVLNFVQDAISYQKDKDYNQTNEFWKPALLTLLDSRGDCEDSSILYNTLMKALGYDVALIEFNHNIMNESGTGHAVAAVHLANGPADAAYYRIDGKKYYYCEPGSYYLRVGEPWVDYFSSSNPVSAVTVV